MSVTSLTAAGKLIMMLLCLCGMPQGKEMLWIDVINQKGVVETIVAKPTADGFALFESDKDDAEKLMDIRRDGSTTSFTVSPDDRKIDLKKIFPAHDFKDISIAPKAELKSADAGTFKITRSGGTVYVTEPSGMTFSIHK
jgi:hypothetical protein